MTDFRGMTRSHILSETLILSAILLIFSAFLTPSPAASVPNSAYPATQMSNPHSPSHAGYHEQQSPGAAKPSSPGIRDFREQIADLRAVLLEAQKLVDNAAQSIQLSSQLRAVRVENDRLSKSLVAALLRKETIERHIDPAHTKIASLTRILVANWLASTRLDRQSDVLNHDLKEKEVSLISSEMRLAQLRQKRLERRAALLALRAERLALIIELDQARHQLAGKRADMSSIEQQVRMITGESIALQHDVTLELRSMISPDH